MTYVFYDGQFLPADQPCLTLNHRGFLFGDGVFTTMAVQNGLLEGYHCHIQRLIKQCDKLNIKMPELSMSWISQLIELNQASGGRWRLKMIVTVENACNLALPDREGKWALLLEPVALTNKPLKVITYHKPINHALSCFKTLSYLERLYLKQYAIDLNVDDVLVTHNGHIVEGAFSSLFWVMDETIFAPHNHFALPSTTLNHIVNAANTLDYNVINDDFFVEDIPSQASVFYCNAVQKMQIVKSIDERKFSLNPVNGLIEALDHQLILSGKFLKESFISQQER